MGVKQFMIVGSFILMITKNFITDWAKGYIKKTLEDRLNKGANAGLMKLFKKTTNEETNKKDEVAELKLALAEEKIKRLEAELALERMKNNLPPQGGRTKLKRIK
jgi:hypothetical protein